MKMTKKRPRTHDDRFISKRVPRDWDFAFYYDDKPLHGFEDSDILTQDVKEYVREKYRAALRRAMGFPTSNTGVLFPAKKDDPSDAAATWPVKQRGKPMMTSPDCALDLPEFKALFYYNLLDWGATGYLAAALNWSVFLCDPNTSKTIHLTHIDNPELSQHHGGQFGTAVKWDIDGRRLAIGTNKSNVQIWDTEEKKLQEYTWCTCCFRQDCTITCLVWSVCNKYLVSGCSSGKLTIILKPDRRMGDFRIAHDGNIVTLKSSPDGKYLASAGSDTTVRLWLWPLLTPHFEIVFDYPARAMAWHPWKPSILAIGGGIKQGTITLYNANNCTRIATSTPHTKGFVLSLAWSSCTGELVASYWIKKGMYDLHSSRSGYTEIVVLSDLNKVVDKFMLGYQTQVMYLLWSPDGKKIATASTDETLRIWNFIHSEGDKEIAEAQKKKKVLPLKRFPQSKASFAKYVVR
ncbi:Protein cortex [Gryllus bimaculatus]|nr:Protein cortex [Gryllus bimaculatus]